ncbi:MAG: endonuclease/exonuclease/phosphatase family protein [Thermoanaerobaculia bacterium]
MQRSRRFFATLLLPALAGALLLIAAPAQAWDRDDGNSKPVTAMTWNLYFGFDEGPVLAAALSGDDSAIVAAATAAWQQVHATDFHRRVRDIALHVRLRAPDLIAVQEAVKYVGPDASGNPETIDHLEILLAALKQVGLEYEVASMVVDSEITLPVLVGEDLSAVTLLDRDAILVRSNHGLKWSNPQHGTFQYLLPIGLPDLPEIKRGWASVDVSASGRQFRFVTTHLEDPSPDPTGITPLQGAQAAELVNVAVSGGLPVVFAGDFNTDGFRKWDTYKLLTGSLSSGGFDLTDAWTATHGRLPGLTWGQSPDLLNRFPSLSQRLDLVLSSGKIRFTDADVVGNTILDRALAGMWPSDHAGLVVKFVP